MWSFTGNNFSFKPFKLFLKKPSGLKGGGGGGGVLTPDPPPGSATEKIPFAKTNGWVFSEPFIPSYLFVFFFCKIHVIKNRPYTFKSKTATFIIPHIATFNFAKI